MKNILTGTSVPLAATERTMYNNAFDSDEQLLAFFDGLGLQLRVLNAVDAAPNVVSLDVLKLSHQILDTAKSKLRLWVLSVDHARQLIPNCSELKIIPGAPTAKPMRRSRRRSLLFVTQRSDQRLDGVAAASRPGGLAKFQSPRLRFYLAGGFLVNV
jgi:hypothetical protein